jgi:putative membrane protein
MQHTSDTGHLAPVDATEIHSLTRPDDKLLTLFIIYAALTTVFFPIAIIPFYFRFKTLRYRFDDEGVAVSYGILWRKETYLTYARIQDIHVTRNIFERWLGLGTVEIQTASGSSSATESIVGVTQFNAIRNYLYANMRGHGSAGAGPTSALQKLPLHSTLAGIRDELRAVRLILEERNHL